MAEVTSISWADKTFNPWIGCTHLSDACDNCYAERDLSHWSPLRLRVTNGRK